MKEFVIIAYNTPLAEITFMQIILGIVAPTLLVGVILLLVVGLGAWVLDVVRHRKASNKGRV